MRLQRAQIRRVALETLSRVTSPTTGAVLEIVDAAAAGTAESLKISRTLKAGSPRRAWPHLHLGFAETFKIHHGVAEVRLDGGRPVHLSAHGPTRHLRVGPGEWHTNPRNVDIRSDLVFEQAFSPATEAAQAYVATLAQTLREGRDDDGDLPLALVLAISRITDGDSYLRRIPFTVQRALLRPAGTLMAGARGQPVWLPRRARTMMARALVIVDFQNDFTPGGALAVERGDEIARRVNALAASGDFDLVVATRDRHPPDHGSFVAQGGTWPVHCVAGTPGAELHPSLDADRVDYIVDKGQDPRTEGYSGFEHTDLEDRLRDHGIDEVTVVGLATDYCVKNTALDALRKGFRVTVDPDAVRGVDVAPGDSSRALEELRQAGATVG